MPVDAPTLKDSRTWATFELFKELMCVRNGGAGEPQIGDVGLLDEEKMMAHVLDCLAAVCEAQRVRTALQQPLTLQEGGDALTQEQQATRNKVFRAALKAAAKGLTHEGAERDGPSSQTQRLLHAFPDSCKLTDGRGWLPMHWAVVADEDKESGVTEADVISMYEMDPMALRKHHLTAVTKASGYTPAHMLCGLEMTEKNMSLVRQLSGLHARGFTTRVAKAGSDPLSCPPYSISTLHIACRNPHRTEALLRLLVQLDPSQVKSFSPLGVPLGLLCAASESLDEHQFGCLVEADSSVDVVHDAIFRCVERKSIFTNRVQTVAKLLEANPAAAHHKDDCGCNLAHDACYGRRMGVADCIEVLKLVLAHNKDALKEADSMGRPPACIAVKFCPVEILDFVLSEYPGAAAVVNDDLQNLLHLVAEDETEEQQEAKARLLCARYPSMMLQRDRYGDTPLLQSCTFHWPKAMALLLCEAGGREAASTHIMHPTDGYYEYNGRLPLHVLIEENVSSLTTQPLSEAADAFRLLLRLYPEAAGIEGGVNQEDPMMEDDEVYTKTPYRLAVECGLPAYYRRLLLRAAPNLNPAELCRLNWAARRTAMFVAFAAVAKSQLLLVQLRMANKDLVKHVMSFL